MVDNSSSWAVCGKSSGVISMPVAARATHRVHMEVMPLFAGYLPLPDVRLFKYLPHHSAYPSTADAGKDSLGGAGSRSSAQRHTRACWAQPVSGASGANGRAPPGSGLQTPALQSGPLRTRVCFPAGLAWPACAALEVRVGEGSVPAWPASLTPVCFADSWIENDSLSVDKHVDDQLDSSSIKSRGSVHSATGSEHKGLPMPRLQPLPPGQVFNSSTGTQVLVIPSRDDHVLEVSVT